MRRSRAGSGRAVAGLEEVFEETRQLGTITDPMVVAQANLDGIDDDFTLTSNHGGGNCADGTHQRTSRERYERDINCRKPKTCPRFPRRTDKCTLQLARIEIRQQSRPLRYAGRHGSEDGP